MILHAEVPDLTGPAHFLIFLTDSIGSEMRMKNRAGVECLMKFLASRDGFHRLCLLN